MLLKLLLYIYFKDGDEIVPRDENGKAIYADHDIVDTWKVHL
jgi:hypothetical protein